jgi:RNA polymerase sigma-70 factor (ECF subfamily)
MNNHENGNNNDNNEKIKRLYLSSADKLFAYLLSVCGNAGLAEDIVAETFLKALENAGRFDDNFNCKAWLFKVATNLMRNTFTRFLKRFLSFSNYRLDARVSGGATPEEIAVKNEEFIKLSAALRKLDRTDAQIIYLKYYESMSYAEIADILQIAEGTMASKLSRALRRLENELK